MPIFSRDTLDFLVMYILIFLEERTGTDLAINFDLAKCVTKINIPKI